MEEAKWEMEGVRRATERYREAALSTDPSSLPSGQWLLRAIVPGLIEEITQLQAQAEAGLATAGRPSRWWWPIQLLPASHLAVMTVICGINAMRDPSGGPSAVTMVSRAIADAARDQLEYQRWVSEQADANKIAKAQGWEHVDVLARMRRQYPRMDRRIWKRWRIKVAALREQWDQPTQVEFGGALLVALCKAAPDHFALALRRESGRDTSYLRVSPETTERMRDIETRAEVARPLLMPMIISPIPWCYPELQHLKPSLRQKPPEGGYLIHKLDLIRVGLHAHTTALDGSVSQEDLDAVNAVQATPWRINQWILDVMAEAWASGIRLGGLEVGEPLSLPARQPDDVWNTQSPEDRAAHAARRRDIHRQNASITGRSQLVLDCLSVATELRDRDRIYFPHSKDFRHRIYCAATRGPNPQGSDIAKSLLMFAEGKPLGEDGFFWLCVRAANCFGYDKATLEERVEWTLGNLENITSASGDPLRSTWWTEAAEPWSFLATCAELVMATSLSKPEAFVSHLPIPLDGSCNGLQHLAAMGLDPIGARATNLTPDPVRQDIYQDVASMVTSLVEGDNQQGVAAAAAWASVVTRKTVKRAVMTTPYGVTDKGIRDQLIADGMIPAADIGGVATGILADYMTSKIVEALTGTVSSARGIMSWLQNTAERLARAGLPFDWTTPSGSRVRQAYHASTVQKLCGCLAGEVSLQITNPNGGLLARKQSAGSAPNYIHSFDAAHLTMTVNACAYAGITNFAMIHDSYGTHAADTTRMGVELRRLFVDIYRTDWPMRLKQEIAIYAPHVVIDDPPTRGDFDVEQVLDAPFFFS